MKVVFVVALVQLVKPQWMKEVSIASVVVFIPYKGREFNNGLFRPCVIKQECIDCAHYPRPAAEGPTFVARRAAWAPHRQ